MSNRITQITPEVVLDGTPNIRLSLITPEVLLSGVPNIRLSHIVVEVLVDVVHPKPTISFVAA